MPPAEGAHPREVSVQAGTPRGRSRCSNPSCPGHALSALALAAGAVLVVFIVVLGICWTIADARRAERLAAPPSALRVDVLAAAKAICELPPK